MRKAILLKCKTYFLFFCFVTLLFVFHPAVGFAEPVPEFNISTAPGKSCMIGDTVTFTVSGSNIKDLYAFEVLLSYDSKVLKYRSSKVILIGNGMPAVSTRNENKVLFGFTRMGKVSGDNGNLVLCEFVFEVLAEKNTAVKLETLRTVDTKSNSVSYAGNELQFIKTSGRGIVQGIILNDELVPMGIPEGTMVDVKTGLDEKTGIVTGRVDILDLQNAFNKAHLNKKGKKTVIMVLPKSDGASKYEMILPVSFFAEKDSTKAIAIISEYGVITIPGNVLAETNLSGVTEVSFFITRADKSKFSADIRGQIGDRPVIELMLKVNGKSVPWNSYSAVMTASIPYEPSMEELQDPEHLTVWRLDDSGKPIPVSSGRYNPETAVLTFNTSQSGRYAIVFVNKTFTDISGYPWADREICVLASKGIINGVGGGRFAPEENITRADFLTLLVRTLGFKAVADEPFKDVQPQDYFYYEAGVARKLGITNGIGNNLFDPGTPITRQDMMVMAARAMRVAGKSDLEAGRAVLDGFSDTAEIAPYAVDSVALLVNSGLIKGTANRINPLHNTTRAEVAVLMYRIYNME